MLLLFKTESYLTQILCGVMKVGRNFEVYSAFLDKRKLTDGFIFYGVEGKGEKFIERFSLSFPRLKLENYK